VGEVPLDVPATELTDPPGGVAAVTSDGDRVYWWTGSQTIALDAADLTPLWTMPGTLGPAVGYGGSVLVPVPGGLAVLDGTTATPQWTIPVDRPAGPVRLATAGDVLLEQRGSEVVALRPSG
jgi:outer membrane protein assembly factor BamB